MPAHHFCTIKIIWMVLEYSVLTLWWSDAANPPFQNQESNRRVFRMPCYSKVLTWYTRTNCVFYSLNFVFCRHDTQQEHVRLAVENLLCPQLISDQHEFYVTTYWIHFWYEPSLMFSCWLLWSKSINISIVERKYWAISIFIHFLQDTVVKRI